MTTNLKAINVSATTTIVAHPARLRGFVITNRAVAGGKMAFSDQGDVMLRIALSSVDTVIESHLTDMGIRFPNTIHVSVPTSVYVTLYYD